MAARARSRVAASLLNWGTGTRTPTSTSRVSRAADYTIPQCIGFSARTRRSIERDCGAPERRCSVRPAFEHAFVTGTRGEIHRLFEEGLSRGEIARQLELARTTVDYHLSRLEQGEEPARTIVPTNVGRTRVETRGLVISRRDQGFSNAEIARTLGISKSTVSYHVRRLGTAVDERCARRYDWTEVQRYHDDGHSVRECQARFGFSRSSWADAIARGVLVGRGNAMPLEDLFVAGTYRSRRNLKTRLLSAGIKETPCECCGLTEWRGAPLALALHHANGDCLDNRLENLRLLCPNCHSQADALAGSRRAV